MHACRGISQLLAVLALGLLLFDLAYSWIAAARFKVRNLEELWGDLGKSSLAHGRRALQAALSPAGWETLAHMPAPVLLLILAGIFYAAFWLLSVIRGGGRASRL